MTGNTIFIILLLFTTFFFMIKYIMTDYKLEKLQSKYDKKFNTYHFTKLENFRNDIRDANYNNVVRWLEEGYFEKLHETHKYNDIFRDLIKENKSTHDKVIFYIMDFYNNDFENCPFIKHNDLYDLHDNTTVLFEFLKRGMDPNIKVRYDSTIIESVLSWSKKDSRNKKFVELLKYGANLKDTTDVFGNPIMKHYSFQDLEIQRAVVKYQKDCIYDIIKYGGEILPEIIDKNEDIKLILDMDDLGLI